MSVRVLAAGVLGKRWGALQIGRGASTDSNLIVSTNDKTGVATIKLNKKPVNSLNLEFLTEMCITLEKMEKSAKGIVLTSSVPGIFCAGLDITEMYQPKIDRCREFWKTLQEMWLRLYSLSIPAVAAVSGHSPAGGCMIAMSCDYRLMAEGKYTIGLNETLLGLVAPSWFQAVMINTIGQRQTEKALQIGKLFTTDEALKVGLVDEVVPQDQLLPRAEEVMATWLKIPSGARALSKSVIRQPTISPLANEREKDIDIFIKMVTASSVQRMMGAYLESLSKKSKEK